MGLEKKVLELRKKSGFSQEELAEKLNVSRQTISKWELNESSPDIRQAKQLSKIFSVSLDELVDNDIKDILTQKISNTEKLAGLTIKILKIFGIFTFVFFIIFGIYKIFLTPKYVWIVGGTLPLNCTLNGKTYSYEITYEDETNDYWKKFSNYYPIKMKIVKIERMEGSSYLGEIIDIEKYEYYWQFDEAVNGYFQKSGGSCN